MKRERYGVTDDGRAVDVFTLTNAAGMRVRILTLGCIIARLEVPDRDGKFANVVLGLDSVADYHAPQSAFRGDRGALRQPHRTRTFQLSTGSTTNLKQMPRRTRCTAAGTAWTR